MALGWPNTEQEAELTFSCCSEQRPVTVVRYSDDTCVLSSDAHECESATADQTHLLSWLSQNNFFTRSVILDNDDEAPLAVTAAAECQRFERRAFVRLDATFPVSIIADGMEVAAITAADVSESGIRGVMTPDQPGALPPVFTLQLHLDGRTVTTDAGVAWSTVVDSENEEHALTGFSFVNPSEAATDAIRSYVFSVQMIRRREENEKSARV